MFPNAYFRESASTFRDLADDLLDDVGDLLGDAGDAADDVVDGAKTVFTTTHADGLRARSDLTDLGDGIRRIGNIELVAPTGRVIVEIATGGLGIETGDVDALDLFDFVDRARATFTAADDVVPFDLDLDLGPVLSDARADAAQTLRDFGDGLPREFDFGGGLDRAVIDAARGDVLVALRDGVLDLTTGAARAEFLDLETLVFDDGALLLDQAGEYADYAYALYAAALTRTPDEDGFRFWNGVMEGGAFGAATREEAEKRLAAEFVQASEFTERFDVSTDASFVTALYENVLERAADRGGFDFWTGAFETGELGREDMLRLFAVSDENRERIADDIDTGYWVV